MVRLSTALELRKFLETVPDDSHIMMYYGSDVCEVDGAEAVQLINGKIGVELDWFDPVVGD
jgi:hypothetical protein